MKLPEGYSAGSLDFARDDKRVCCKKAPAKFRGRFHFLLGIQRCGYGLVVVVVVVSSRLITAAGCANTTLRTTIRSPTVE